MAQITEQAAQRYAAAVIEVLAAHFPDLRDGNLRQAVHNAVAQQAMDPDDWFERVIAWDSAWRLHPGDVYATRRQVHLEAHGYLAAAEEALVERINARLRAIELED
jgi:hypothetical protein